MNERKRIITTLVEYGLSKTEAEIYLICLKNKDITPYEISKYTKIPRTTIYDIVMNLALKQLLTLKQSDGFTKQQTLIRAKNPSVFRKILRAKRESLFKIEDKVIQILPLLKSDFHTESTNADFNYYEGIEGVKRIYLEESEEPIESDVYVWSYLLSDDLIGATTIQQDIAKRRRHLKTGLGDVKTIIPLTEWTKHVLSYQFSRDPDFIYFNKFRYVESGMEDFVTRISVKNDTIRIVSAEEDDVWGIKIESTSLAKSLKSMHKIMWLGAKPITSKIVVKWGENELLKGQKLSKK